MGVQSLGQGADRLILIAVAKSFITAVPIYILSNHL